MKNFLKGVIKGIVFATFLTINSVIGMIGGIWGVSDHVATLWMIRWDGKTGSNPLMFWIIKMFAFLLHLIAFCILFHYLQILAFRALGWTS